MSDRRKPSTFPRLGSTARSPVQQMAPTPSRELGGDPLCSEDLDAQIRWFFEHAGDLHPL